MYLHTADTIEIVWYQFQYLTEVLEWLWSYLFNNFSIARVILAPSSPISLGIKKVLSFCMKFSVSPLPVKLNNKNTAEFLGLLW